MLLYRVVSWSEYDEPFKVATAIKEGWKPLGGIAISNSGFLYQAMTKEENVNSVVNELENNKKLHPFAIHYKDNRIEHTMRESLQAVLNVINEKDIMYIVYRDANEAMEIYYPTPEH